MPGWNVVLKLSGLFMTVVVRLAPRKRIEELETDEVQVVEFRRLATGGHFAGMAGYVENEPVAVDFASLVLHFNGNAVAGLAVASFVDEYDVRLVRLVAQFAGDVGSFVSAMFLSSAKIFLKHASL